MTMLSNKEIQNKRAEAQKLTVTAQVGKGGINEATLSEIGDQLKRRKLVKVRLLPSATEGGTAMKEQAAALAAGTESTLIEVRGHTAVLFRP